MPGEVWPTEAVFISCLRGLDQYERRAAVTDDHGGTDASIAFASLIRDGFPVDHGMCAQVVAAHEALLGVPAHARMLPKFATARLLWGGDTAYDWAKAAIETGFTNRQHQPATVTTTPTPTANWVPPAPVPVAAAVIPDRIQAALDALTDDITRIEERAKAELRAAFWVAYRTALRHAGATVQRRANGRIPIAAQASAGLEGDQLNQLRARLDTVHPYERWVAAGPILAAMSLELDHTISSELDDYEATAEQILEDTERRLVKAVARRLKVRPELLVPFIPAVSHRLHAAKRLAHGLLDWTRARLSIDRAPEDLPQLTVPEFLFGEAIGTAAGQVDSLQGWSIGAVIARRLIEAIQSGRVASEVIPAAVNLELVWTWRRGDPPMPFPPHLELEDKSWTDDIERQEAVGEWRPGDHHGCQCFVETGWRSVSGS